MKTNKEILEILESRKGELLKFADYLQESRQLLKFRLKSEFPIDNLSGVFERYLFKRAEQIFCETPKRRKKKKDLTKQS